MREGTIPVVWLDFEGNVTDDRCLASPCMKFELSNPLLPERQKISTWLLVDTGADMCQLFEGIFQQLACAPIRHAQMISNHGTKMQPIYEMTYRAEGTAPPVDGEASVCSIGDHPVPYTGLVGRHYLQYGRLILDGPQGESAFFYRFPVPSAQPQNQARDKDQAGFSSGSWSYNHTPIR